MEAKRKLELEWSFTEGAETAQIVTNNVWTEHHRKGSEIPTYSPTQPIEILPTSPITTTDIVTDNNPMYVPTNQPTIEPLSVLFIDDKDARFIRFVSRWTLRLVGVGVIVGVGVVVVSWVMEVVSGLVVVLTDFLADCLVLAKQGLLILGAFGGLWLLILLLRSFNDGDETSSSMPNGEGSGSPHIQVTINTGNNVTQHNN